jgi:hypothetical protein
MPDLINKHKGEDAWLFGKGPSLDSFCMDDAGSLRATVNHACYVVPSPVYCFSFFIDRQEICPPEGCEYITGEGMALCNDIGEYKAGDLFFKYSSAELAASYLIACGIEALHLIGFDPKHLYSKHFVWPRNRGLNGRETSERYMIKNNIAEMASRAGVNVYDYGINN